MAGITDRIRRLLPDIPSLRGKGLETRVLVRLLMLTGSLRNPGLTARILRLGIRRTRLGVGVGGHARHRLLMLSKDMFNEDMEASFGGCADVTVYRMHRRLIKAVAYGFLPRHIDDNNYVNLAQEDELRKRKCRAYWVQVLGSLRNGLRIDAVLTGNFAYYAERELGGALEEMGIPFIAIHKECVRSPGYADFFAGIYRERRGPFSGRRILCYDEAERDLEIRAGVAPGSRITVTGMPRLDFLHRLRRGHRPAEGRRRPRILFFSFGPRTTLPLIMRKMSGPPYTRFAERLDPELEALSWGELHREMHQAMLECARGAPDAEVVIKSKGVSGDNEGDMIKSVLGIEQPPENLRLVLGGNPHDLMLESDVVCGFNSTALFEAIAADRPVVVPRFAEAAQQSMAPYLIDYEDAVEYAFDRDDLVSRLLDKLQAPRPPREELPESSRRVLRRWLHNDDGQAGERVRSAVFRGLAHTPEEIA